MDDTGSIRRTLRRLGPAVGRILFQRSYRKRVCSHLGTIELITPGTFECRSCREEGTATFHLRMCLVCGEVGCCDSSEARHARRHHAETGHALIRSIEPREHWVWCYEDRAYLPDAIDRGDVVTADLASDTRLPRSLRAAAALSVLFGVGATVVLAVTLALLVVRGEPPPPWGPVTWGRGGFLEEAGSTVWRAGVAVALVATATDVLIGRDLQFARRRGGHLTLAKAPVDVAWVAGLGTPMIAVVVYPLRLVLVLAGWRHLRPRRVR